MELMNKRNRIQIAAMQLFQEQGVDTTSVNEIVKRANVAKGTFYIYYKDKQELITQILTKKHGCLLNELINTSFEKARYKKQNWLYMFVVDMITYYETHPDILEMIQKHNTEVMDTREHCDLVLNEIERLPDFLSLLQHQAESKRQSFNRFLLILQMTGFLCYNAIFNKIPDNIEHMKPLFIDIIMNICDCEEVTNDL